MKCRKAYAIIPVGENDRSAHVAQQKAPEVATPGLFYSVLGGWLNPKAGYQLFFSVQPFADVVGKIRRWSVSLTYFLCCYMVCLVSKKKSTNRKVEKGD